MFITTANLLDPIPPALRDRMEVLELTGYTEEEKLEIAFSHLLPRQLEAHGLTKEQMEVGPQRTQRRGVHPPRAPGLRVVEGDEECFHGGAERHVALIADRVHGAHGWLALPIAEKQAESARRDRRVLPGRFP